MLTQLTLPHLSAPPAPLTQNTFRRYAVELEASSLDLLQRVIDVEINKHRFGFCDQFCGDFRIAELMGFDALLPNDGGFLIVNGLDLRYLFAYTTQRILLMDKFETSILAKVTRTALCSALIEVQNALIQATEIVPIGLPLGCS